MEAVDVALEIPGLRDFQRVGEGGFATVYRARDEAFARWVAVKVLHTRLLDQTMRLRFAREAQALGALGGHPNIVGVHAGGVLPEGTPYLVMPYLAGGSLAVRLEREGPLAWRRVAELGVRLAGALETAHRAEILHRDVKPENILLNEYDDPELADFGIARVAGAAVTRTVAVTASVAHAAPEVLYGGPPTSAVDVYGLGSTMFALLTGRAPFVQENDHLVALIGRTATQPVPDLRPHGVADELAQVIERAMAKTPDERQPSALAFGRALQQVQRQHGFDVTTLQVRDEPSAEPSGKVAPPAQDPIQNPIRIDQPGGARRPSSSTVVTPGVQPPVLPSAAAAAAAPRPRGSTARLSGPLVRRVELRNTASGEEWFVIVRGDAARPISELRARLLARAGNTGALSCEGHPLPDDGVVADLGLHDGATLFVGPWRPDPLSPVADRFIRVVSGPTAGSAAPVAPTATVGRGQASDLRLPDPEVSRPHAVFSRHDDGIDVADSQSSNGTYLEGEEVQREQVEVGEMVRVGNTLLEVVAPETGAALQLESRDGTRRLNRRFRSGLVPPPQCIRFPRRPTSSEPPPLNILLTIAPGAAFAGIALATGRLQLLIFAVVSPLIAVARTVAGRRTHKKKQAKAAADYTAALDRAERELSQARAAERSFRRRAVPDAARVADIARLPTRDLWSRRPEDPDVLLVRVGSTSTPSEIGIEGEDANRDAPRPPQPWIPVALPLLEVGGIALVGPLERLRPLARWCVLQAAVLHAPPELRIVVLAGDAAQEAWWWVRWLPHLRDSPDDPFVLIGSDATSRGARVEELRRLLQERRELAAGRPTRFLPRVLVVYEDVSARLDEGVAELLRDGPTVGIHALTLDTEQVPEGCNASVVMGATAADGIVERGGRPPVREVFLEGVTTDLCEDVARRLAPVRLVGEGSADALPGSVRLLDVLGIEAEPASIAARWAANAEGSTSAVIGVGADGPSRIDLVRDGPHALVAGTTRSGKSEFIKTLVASLVVENHPDDLAFLFIDFKGGGDYQVLKRLPHAIDLTTSQDDDAAFDRALTMLEAELVRRQRVIGGAQATTVEGYQAARRRPGGPTLPLPRLLVVVDEFAELKDRRPNQLDKLVSVARTGAAFGIHLLLATQRPSGVVTGQIDANVGLRVCFRVSDEQESRDVIGAPDAGRVAEHHRGRCFYRSASTPLTESQSARVASARPGSVATDPIRVDLVSWERLGRPEGRVRAGEVPDPETDLWDLMEAATAAAAAAGWREPAIPWPRALPARVTLGELPEAEGSGDRVVVGLVDDPAEQRRKPLVVELGAGHVAVVGSQQSGRTTALRSFLVGLGHRLPPAAAHLAVLDWAGGGLRAAAALPHCIGVAVDDWEVCERLLKELEGQVKQRHDRFASEGWSDLRDQRSSSTQPLPWLVLVVDGWDALAEEGVRRGVAERLATLLSRGASVGLQAMLTGERATASGVVARHITHRYVLPFNRAQDAELHGIRARQLPSTPLPGRALEARTGRLVQFAQLDAGEDGSQAAAFQRELRQIGSASAVPTGASGPRKVRPLPARIGLAELLEQGPPPPDAVVPLLVGLSGDQLRPWWLDLAESSGSFFVAGPPGSGRSTALLSFAWAALECGLEVIAIAPRQSPLAQLEGQPGVRELRHDAAGLEVGETEDAHLLVVVDDLESLPDAGPLEMAVRGGLDGVGVVAAAPIDRFRDENRGLAGALKRARAGLLLSPQNAFDGMMLGGRLAENLLFDGPPGRGVAGFRGQVGVVQVPS